MAGRIKGITVEIGGDTTGLEKALKSVNTTIKNTQSQLKDVNRLLKLDPSNTELLSQKQRALKEAIGATRDKLETLKQAQEQAKQALENGDLGQDKYDALQREIIETEAFCQGIVDRLNALGFDFGSIVDVLKSLWDGLCQFLAPVFEAAFNVVSTVLGTVLDVITGLLDVFIGLFTGNWSQMWEGVKEIFSGIWDGITGLFDIALNLLKSLAETVFGWFGATWESVWTGIKTFFETIWNGIVAFFSGIWNAIVSTVTAQINAVKTVVTKADADRKASEKASREAAEARGKKDAAEKELVNRGNALFEGIDRDDWAAEADRQYAAQQSKILLLDDQISAEQKRIDRKQELGGLIPQKQTEKDSLDNKTREQASELAALKAQEEGYVHQIEAFGEKLQDAISTTHTVKKRSADFLWNLGTFFNLHPPCTPLGFNTEEKLNCINP